LGPAANSGSTKTARAIDFGEISARSADSFLRLTPPEQAAELERRLSEAHERERIHSTVARTIREYLDTTLKVDLQEINQRIREALS
jgi:hypothetical protein